MSTYEGQYEPKDSRDVTLSNERAPGEPDRTGHREGEARQQEQQQSAQGEGEEKQRASSDLTTGDLGTMGGLLQPQ